TGDLRLREVVGQWHHTLTQDRANPEYIRASRLGLGRDNNNALGEIIDLYQLTYDPAILALMAPAVERFQKDMKNWGLPVGNVLSFHRDPVTHQQLLDSVRLRVRDNSKDPHLLFTGHSHESMVALASLMDPSQNYSTAALAMLPP